MPVTGGFIEQCEQEPLHLSGAIQPHGALLIADAEQRITHASENVSKWLKPADQVIGTELPAAVTAMMADLASVPGNCVTRINVPIGDHAASVVVTRSLDGSAAIEFFPYDADANNVAPLPLLAFGEFADRDSLVWARQLLVEHIQRHTGFDRVLYYEFHHDDTGEVVAEALASGTEGSYYGLRFPASDIPKIARDLYMKTPWRTIPDAGASPVRVVGRSSVPPDFSYVDLRSVSPVHVSYMRNMGVVGAASVPVKTATRLQALISCHAGSPKRLTLPELQALADQVSTFNLRVREFVSSRRMKLLDELEFQFGHWRKQLVEAGSLAEAWPEFSLFLLEQFGADGVLFDTGSRQYQAGIVPDPEAMNAIQDWLSQSDDASGLTMSQSIVHDCAEPVLTEVAGLASVSVRSRGRPELNCCLFRVEEIQEVAWGGNPNKPAEWADGSYQITPRRSFERWVETRIGYCREWPEHTHMKLLKLRGFMADFLG